MKRSSVRVKCNGRPWRAQMVMLGSGSAKYAAAMIAAETAWTLTLSSALDVLAQMVMLGNGSAEYEAAMRAAEAAQTKP